MATDRQKEAARQNAARARQAQSARAHGERVPSSSEGMSTAEQNRLDKTEFAFPRERKEPLTDARHVRNAIVPINKRRKPEIYQREQFRSVQGLAPNAFAFLKIAQQMQAVEEQPGNDHRGEQMRELGPLVCGDVYRNHQRHRQAPEERGQAPHQAP